MDPLTALTGAYGDHPDAVRIGAERASWSALAQSADRIAARIAGEYAIAVTARHCSMAIDQPRPRTLPSHPAQP